MPFLIKSKGVPLRMRDGSLATDPVYIVAGEFVPFKTLPAGLTMPGDGDVEIREVQSLDGVKPGALYVKAKIQDLPLYKHMALAPKPGIVVTHATRKASLAAVARKSKEKKEAEAQDDATSKAAAIQNAPKAAQQYKPYRK